MKLPRTISFFAVVSLCVIICKCSKQSEADDQKHCYDTIPNKVAGLKVEGERTKRNIIKNMVPYVCRIKEIYAEAQKGNPDLKGMIELRFVVEFQGEVTTIEIQRKTIEDEQFISEFMKVIRSLEFDYFGSHNSETEVVYPIKLGK
ncbi:MAG: AgmX/PglI C-terminal domain-containing protein [Chitinivibrionales bacterium]|nr:AgmX/PglI C-terminal domain-containing protein [Chitinivibrionales bacterium]